MVIFGNLPHSFNRMTSAWDSVPLPEINFTALTSRLLVEVRRTLVKYNGRKYPDDIAFFADSSTQKQDNVAQGFQRGGSGDHRDSRDIREDTTEAATKDEDTVSTTIKIRKRRKGDATTVISQTT